MKKYSYVGILLPTFFVSPNDGKQYIIPAWIEVEPGTTIDQVEWNKPEFLKKYNNDNQPTGSI
jgi:hypothetical protein